MAWPGVSPKFRGPHALASIPARPLHTLMRPPQLGAVIYASRVPERWLPGRFDVWFHGHQVNQLATDAHVQDRRTWQ